MNDDTSSGTGTRKSTRILIADDSVVFRETCALFLDSLHDVDVVGAAGDGEEALALVTDTRPDLVLMDMQMPRLNGLQATRRIRADFPEVKVIMITLHDSEELKAASITAGADRFILKRCLFDELPGAIAHLFPGRYGVAEKKRP